MWSVAEWGPTQTRVGVRVKAVAFAFRFRECIRETCGIKNKLIRIQWELNH